MPGSVIGNTPDFGSGFPGSSPGRATLEGFHRELYEQEQTHWWHVGKRERVLALIARYGTRASARRLLDIGCGTGGMLAELARRGQAVGMDAQAEALAFCRQRGAQTLIQHDLAQSPWPIADAQFDVVTALDVVEHVDRDDVCVREIHRVLKPGGVAVVSVPAFQWLWSYWDEWLGHRRRYTRRQLVALMRQAGFHVVWASYAECLTLGAIAPLRWWKGRQVARGRDIGSDNAPPPGWVNRMLLGYERMENRLLRWIVLPWGTSVAVVGMKESARQ